MMSPPPIQPHQHQQQQPQQRRKKPPPPPLRSRSSFLRERSVKTAFYVWMFLACSLFVVLHQFGQTRKVARLTSQRDHKSAFLPEWSSGLMAANDYLNAWWHNGGDNDDEDELQDDDNVYEEDDDDDDDGNTSVDENAVKENNKRKNAQPPAPTTKQEQQTLKELELEIKQLRQAMDEYARDHGGKLSPQLMMKYQKALRRKRGMNRKIRQQQKQQESDTKTYYDKDDPKYYDAAPANYGKRRAKGANARITRWNRNIDTGANASAADVVKGMTEMMESADEDKDYHNKVEQAKQQRMERRQRAVERRAGRRQIARAQAMWKPPGHNTTDYTQYPILPSERTLPDMSEGRGVIFFLHVPKTGGQSIRQMNPRFRRKLQRQANKKMFKQWERAAALARQKPGEDPLLPQPPPELELSPQAQEFERLCQDRIRFVVANTLDVFLQHAVPQVNGLLGGADPDSDKILFVEVHGMDNYHALELEPYLQYWREQAKKADIPYFAFTILREAMSLQVSFFNWYYIHPGDPRFCINPLKPQQKCGQSQRDRWRKELHKMRGDGRRDRLSLSDAKERFMDPRQRLRNKVTHENGMTDMSHKELEKAVLKVAYDNPQCLFLARGERTFGDVNTDDGRQRLGLDRNECQGMYMSLQRTMDWIGRTDTLTTETLPLLANIMFKRPDLGPHLPKANVSPHDGGWLKLSKASQATLKGLDQKSQLDQELYHRVKEDYTMDQWDRSSPIE